jgi:hypothetical protein
MPLQVKPNKWQNYAQYSNGSETAQVKLVIP